MYITVTEHIFTDYMQSARPDNFSYEGLQELFSYLDEAMGENTEFDPIAICCDFSQCSLKEFLDAFPDVEEDLEEPLKDWEEMQEAITDYIEKNGYWFAFVEDGKCIVFENF
jgi:hypothetical protein